MVLRRVEKAATFCPGTPVQGKPYMKISSTHQPMRKPDFKLNLCLSESEDSVYDAPNVIGEVAALPRSKFQMEVLQTKVYWSFLDAKPTDVPAPTVPSLSVAAEGTAYAIPVQPTLRSHQHGGGPNIRGKSEITLHHSSKPNDSN